MNKKKINGKTKKDLIRKGIIALCEEHREFKTQGEIAKALEKNDCNLDDVKQVDVSRALSELKIEKRKYKDGYRWYMDYNSSQEDEIENLSDLFRRSKTLPNVFNVDVLVVQTDPYCNTMIAQQIEKTFSDRVISTFCPNEVDIIIFYRTRKKDKSFSKEIREIRNKIKKSRESKIKEH